ncbi:protease-4 [Bacillus mesophilus]|uniref:Signal peptide peptidase SppA n=1 Tax=Bacillus mesophilus TaxID=1808955 RepID=A0A6M0Q8T2_9BACI|nr:signal peptide peptidase SppA [Bacillus mesophilus]MBM7660531.1 protease-4 [Bacillus mesophilus]NEY71920.1 signal peptide peptidase SppA [Bacillus mesophilus]
MNSKRWIALGIAVGLFIFSAIVNVATSLAFGNFSTFSEDLFPTDEEFVETVLEEGDSLDKVVVLDVNGAIMDSGDVSSIFQAPGYDHRAFLRMLDQASEDRSIKGILIRVNSPGGGVVESAEIHDRITEIQEETKKPVYISMGSMAASGGYYIAAPANKIYASPETLTGSLGVIFQSLNYSGLAEKYGVKLETVKSGPYKDIMNPARDMTEDEREILQSMINNSYSGFVKVISEGREIPEDRVREIADGRIYDGRQALELDLIDEFGYWEDAIEGLKTDHDLGDVSVIQYESAYGFSSILTMGVQKMVSSDLEMTSLMKLLSQPNAPRPMYLYQE